MLVMSGTNPESKNTVRRRRVLVAIRQSTPAARPIQKFQQTKILPDYRCCRMKEYWIKEVQSILYLLHADRKFDAHQIQFTTQEAEGSEQGMSVQEGHAICVCGAEREDLKHFVTWCTEYNQERIKHPKLQRPYRENEDWIIGDLFFDNNDIEITKETLPCLLERIEKET